jgi:hypothetical protein
MRVRLHHKTRFRVVQNPLGATNSGDRNPYSSQVNVKRPRGSVPDHVVNLNDRVAGPLDLDNGTDSGSNI